MTAAIFAAALPAQRTATWAQQTMPPVTCIDQYDLEMRALAGARVLVTTMHQDQRWLERRRDILVSFLDSGGTVILQGQIVIPYLDGLRPFEPLEQPSLEDYAITITEPAHPLFAGIDPARLNNRRGVAGFYARGSNPPPEGARVLSALRGGQVAVDWVVAAGKGRIFVHSGNDLWTTFHDAESNAQLAGNLVRWALGEEEMA